MCFDCNETPLCLCHCACSAPSFVQDAYRLSAKGVPCEVSSGNEHGEDCMESSSASLVHIQSQAFNVN